MGSACWEEPELGRKAPSLATSFIHAINMPLLRTFYMPGMVQACGSSTEQDRHCPHPPPGADGEARKQYLFVTKAQSLWSHSPTTMWPRLYHVPSLDLSFPTGKMGMTSSPLGPCNGLAYRETPTQCCWGCLSYLGGSGVRGALQPLRSP